MSSLDSAADEPRLSESSEPTKTQNGLTIIDVIWIAALTFALSFVFGLIYSAYLGVQGYDAQEILGYFDLPEGQAIAGQLALWAIFVGLLLILGIGAGLETFLDTSEAARLSGANNALVASHGLMFIASLMLIIVLVPFAEELFFRAALYGAFVRYVPPFWAGLFSACVFTAAHTQYIGLGGNAALIGSVQIFLLGGVLVWLYSRSGSIWPSVFLHATNNAIAMIAVIFLA